MKRQGKTAAPPDHDNQTDNQTDGRGGAVRLEYESLFSLGSLCEIDDADVVLRAIGECDRLGIDTISFGGTVAFAMECAERGWADLPWLRFGSGPALLRCLKELESGTAWGRQLAMGSRWLAEQWGPDAQRIAPHVKGLELPGYSPQALHSMAVGFAVGARGADHNRSGAYEVDFSDRVNRKRLLPEQVQFAVETEDRAALMDSLILCKFLRGALEDFYEEVAEMLRLTTGWEFTPIDLRETAQRIIDAKKRFNIRAGWTAGEDTLPERMLREPLTDDPDAALTAEQLHQLIQAYYRCRGWDEAGIPNSPSP